MGKPLPLFLLALLSPTQLLTSTYLCTLNGTWEGNECKGNDKGWHCRSTVHQHRNEEERVWTDPEQPRRNCNTGSEEHWSVRNPRPLQNQNPNEASNQGREEGGLRKSGDGKSKTGEKSGQGFPSLCLEEECMRMQRSKIGNTCMCGVSRMAGEQVM